jgi:hypothetical protein
MDIISIIILVLKLLGQVPDMFKEFKRLEEESNKADADKQYELKRTLHDRAINSYFKARVNGDLFAQADALNALTTQTEAKDVVQSATPAPKQGPTDAQKKAQEELLAKLGGKK